MAVETAAANGHVGGCSAAPYQYPAAGAPPRAYRSEGRGACMCHGAYNEGTVLSDCVCAHETRALMKGNGVQLQRVRNPKSISCSHVKALKAACQ